MRILVVEDNDIVRALIAKELKSGGYEIFEAKNGLSALELIPDIQPHLITMDVEMPQMNGFDTCFKIRTEIQPNLSLSQNQLPIIFITSNDTLEDRAKGFQVGVSDFITKPFLKGEVLKTVNKLLRQESALKGLVTLVVEDNDMSRHLLNNILQSEGIVTLLAANGVEALKIFQTKESEIDLVLTDFLMPQMNGEELCQKIRNEFGNRTTPIIFLSAMSERDSILEMFKAGASDYVIKPFAKEELVARIRVHLESRVLNKKLFEQVQELKHLNKLKDEFLTVTSHDLKSPLNGILGFTRIMLDEVVPPELQTEYLGHIRSSGEFLLSMINDILTLSQIQAQNENFEQIPVSLDEIALSSVQTIKHMANPKGIQINYKLIGKEKPSVSCNNNDLTRIFNNLLSNAIKFTHKKGKVELIIESQKNKTVNITVSDNGVGIPAKQIANLFDRFSLTSRHGTEGEKGSGLGLSITKELVERHNGTITVTSELEKGTSFKILFPLYIKEPDKPTGDKQDYKHIFIIDDNHLNIKLSSTILSQLGFKVTCAYSGLEALDLIRANLKKFKNKMLGFDLLLVDLFMPGMDGFETTKKIRGYEKDFGIHPVPILAMTGKNQEISAKKFKEAELNEKIEKPIKKDLINAIISKLS